MILENNSNPQCRNSATIVLCSLYKFIGDSIKKLLVDINNKNTMKVIENEFNNINIKNSNNNVNNKIIDSLFPRQDISKKITPKMLKDLNEGKWQEKKEIIDQISQIIISHNKKILPNGLSEFVSILKQKLKDSNKNLVRFLIQFIILFSESLGNSLKI